MRSNTLLICKRSLSSAVPPLDLKNSPVQFYQIWLFGVSLQLVSTLRFWDIINEYFIPRHGHLRFCAHLDRSRQVFLKAKNCCPTKIAEENGRAKGRGFVPLHSFAHSTSLMLLVRVHQNLTFCARIMICPHTLTSLFKKIRNTAFFGRVCFVNTDETQKLILVYCNLMNFW